MYYYNPMMDGHDWGWGIFMMAFWVIVIIAVGYGLTRLLSNHEATTSTKIDPVDIAKERYAKGEITKEQFAEIKKELK